jgi:hypothetical protein
LINAGPFTDLHPEDVLGNTQRNLVSMAMGLTRDEEKALYKYSQGRKDEPDSYGHMDDQAWRDLESAVSKIPSMGALGLESTVFRGDRTPDFAGFLLSRYGKPCYVIHGAATTGAGIHHLASAAFVANSHGLRALCLVRIQCKSARYVQYWGMHGASLDGGEVLIPAGTISYYDGQPAQSEQFWDQSKPVFTLKEVLPNDVKPGIPFFDDFKGNEVPKGVISKLIPGLLERLEKSAKSIWKW